MENQEQPQVRIEVLNREISILSTQLKDLSAKKESGYKDKEARDLELNSLIKIAKELRDAKAKIDSEVKDLKKIRDVDNKGLKEYYGKLAERKVQQTPAEKKGKQVSPALMKKQVEAMSYAIETEGLSFEKEKSYMDKIKRLKVQLAEIEKEDAKFAEFRKLRTEIIVKKKEADTAHEKIQTLARESSGIFAQLKEKSEQIAKAKKARSLIQTELKDMKGKIDEVDSKLVSVLSQWSEITKSSPPIEIPAQTQASQQLSAMEQLRSKKKLTKEDILALQKAAMRRR